MLVWRVPCKFHPAKLEGRIAAGAISLRSGARPRGQMSPEGKPGKPGSIDGKSWESKAEKAPLQSIRLPTGLQSFHARSAHYPRAVALTTFTRFSHLHKSVYSGVYPLITCPGGSIVRTGRSSAYFAVLPNATHAGPRTAENIGYRPASARSRQLMSPASSSHLREPTTATRRDRATIL